MTFASQASERDQRILEQVTQPYDPSEQEQILRVFAKLLALPTQDGGRKRAARTKAHWTVDTTHEAAMFRHLARWKSGDLVDEESGAHALVHVGWRALALAVQEMGILSLEEALDNDAASSFPNGSDGTR